LVLPVRRFKLKLKIVGEWIWDQKCVVCLGEVKPGDDVVVCPSCGAMGHRGHFLELLKVKAICPNCKRNIRERDLMNA